MLLASASPAATDKPFEPIERLPLPNWLNLEVDHRIRYEYLDNRFRAGAVGGRRHPPTPHESPHPNPGCGLAEPRRRDAAELLQAYLELSLEGPFGGAQMLV